jgi:hypothetical protein
LSTYGFADCDSAKEAKMTETATHGATSQPQTPFLNGSTPLGHGLRRKAAKTDPELEIRRSDRRPAGTVASADSADGDGSWPVLEVRGLSESLRLWQGSCATSYRVAEIVWGAVGAMTSARLARTQAAGERAVAAAQAMAAEADAQARVELGWGYFQDSIDHMFAAAAASLELVAQPTREILELLALPASDSAAPETTATDRAA